jgi:hypothetical protein
MSQDGESIQSSGDSQTLFCSSYNWFTQQYTKFLPYKVTIQSFSHIKLLFHTKTMPPHTFFLVMYLLSLTLNKFIFYHDNQQRMNHGLEWIPITFIQQ